MRYVIVGNSTAALGGIEGIRSVDKTGEITVISAESHAAYARPMISYLLEGKTDLERMRLRSASFSQDMGVNTRLGERAASICPGEKTLVLESGENIPYDKLLIATGSVPFLPQIEGMETVEKKFTFLSLDDALALEKALTPNSRALILGAGLIGLKCAEGILHRVRSLEVVDLADRVLPSILDEAGSRRVQACLERQGIAFSLGDTVRRFAGNRAVLESGKELEFDVLITAAGVRPNVALVKEAGGKCGKGIRIDAAGRTSLEDVYAAGDCCESLDVSCGESRVLALLPNAYRQGECAGKTMAGEPSLLEDAVPMNAIGFFGLHMITAGSYRGEKLLEETPERYKAFFVEDNVLKGFILMGDCLEDAGVYTALVRERTPLSAVDFALLRQKPQFMAFSVKRRKEMFARPV